MSVENDLPDGMEYVEADSAEEIYAQMKKKRKRLRAIIRKIEMPGMICAALLEILGIVTAAGGIVIVLRDEITVGLIITAVGAVLGALAFPVYALISRRRKMEYLEEIFLWRK